MRRYLTFSQRVFGPLKLLYDAEVCLSGKLVYLIGILSILYILFVDYMGFLWLIFSLVCIFAGQSIMWLSKEI